jgi:hypothetical protein
MNSSIEDGSVFFSFWIFSSVISSHFSSNELIALSLVALSTSFSCDSRISATFSAFGSYVCHSSFHREASIIILSCCVYPCRVFSLSLYVSFTSLIGLGCCFTHFEPNVSGLIGFHIHSVTSHSAVATSGFIHGNAFSIGCCCLSRSDCFSLFSLSILLCSISFWNAL